MTCWRRWIVCGLAVLNVLLGVGPASAAEGLIQRVEVRDGAVRVFLSEVELPLGVRPEDAMVVTIDGDAVDARVAAVGGEQTTSRVEQRTVLLVLDTSGSMQGGGLRNAQQAAAKVLSELPTDVRVGLVTFSSDVVLHVAPTLDRRAVAARLQALTAGGRTRLYDAVPVALGAAGVAGERRLLILSDGKDDDVSSNTVSAAAAAISSSGVTVDVLDTSADASGAGLGPLAVAGRGRAVSASGAEAIAVFNQLAQTYATQVTAIAMLPPDHPGGDATVQVEIDAVGGLRAEERAVRLPAPDIPVPAQPAVTAESTAPPITFWLMLAAVGLGVFLLLAAAVVMGDSRAEDARRTKEALLAYGREPRATYSGSVGGFGGAQLTQSALKLAERAVQRRGSAEKLALALDRAGLTWRPHEWLLLRAVSTVIGAAICSLLLGQSLLALLVGTSVGWFGPSMWLKRTARRRQKAFLVALPDSLQLLASSLSSGYSLAQALDALVQEGNQPMAGEMGRALAEARIGRPLEDSLDAVGERMDCEDFRWVVMAVRVQRQVGGNLAEVLARVCTTMRDRASLRRQVQALSAEGRMSAYLLIALPIALGAFMFFFRRDYFRPMYTETIGIFALGVTVVMMAVGTVWMNKLIKVDL